MLPPLLDILELVEKRMTTDHDASILDILCVTPIIRGVDGPLGEELLGGRQGCIGEGAQPPC